MSRNLFPYITIIALLIPCSFLCLSQESDEQRLLDAAKNGLVASVQSLLDRGVSSQVKDENGRTPLHLSSAGGHQETAEVILKAGVDINAKDNNGKTPLDLAKSGGHTALASFLLTKGATESQDIASSKSDSPRILKPSLKFQTVEEFENEIGEPAVILDSDNICFFAPKRREMEARIVSGYLVKAYDALYEIVGTHTNYKIAVYAFSKGNPHGWGGTSDCSIEYDDSNLDFSTQPEWTQYKVPHVSGYIEEMAHNFVGATKAQFGWEMIGWSLGIEVSHKIAGNPILTNHIRATRDEQEKTFEQYVHDGFVFPKGLPPNLCDRIHARILYKTASKYGSSFWTDFFREIRKEKQALTDAVRLSDNDKIRNARYQITIECFERLPGIEFKEILKSNGISLTTDVKSLHPEAPGWNRHLSE